MSSRATRERASRLRWGTDSRRPAASRTFDACRAAVAPSAASRATRFKRHPGCGCRSSSCSIRARARTACCRLWTKVSLGVGQHASTLHMNLGLLRALVSRIRASGMGRLRPSASKKTPAPPPPRAPGLGGVLRRASCSARSERSPEPTPDSYPSSPAATRAGPYTPCRHAIVRRPLA
jgi:hypothetical protein